MESKIQHSKEIVTVTIIDNSNHEIFTIDLYIDTFRTGIDTVQNNFIISKIEIRRILNKISHILQQLVREKKRFEMLGLGEIPNDQDVI